MTRKIKGSIKLEPQSATPTAEKGVAYYDSDDDKLKVCTDDDTFENLATEDYVQDTVLENAPLVSSAQNYFETLKHAGDVDNEDYLIADLFTDIYTTFGDTDRTGIKDTISTSATSAIYDGIDNYGLKVVNVSSSDTDYSGNTYTSTNVFDDNDSTNVGGVTGGVAGGANITRTMGKTFSSRYVKNVRIKTRVFYGLNNYAAAGYVKLYLYNGSTWTETHSFWELESPSSTGGSDQYINIYGSYDIDNTIQGVRVDIHVQSNTSSDWGNAGAWFYTISYGDEFSSSNDVETNTLIALDGTEKGLIVYDKSDKPTNTSINVDVSDGTTTLTAQTVRSYIDISSLSSGNLSLDFNLATTNTSVTPSLYGYGVLIIK